MDLQSLEALVSLILTIVPIALALLGTVFGIRVRRRAASTKQSAVTIVQMTLPPDKLEDDRRRQRRQFWDLGLGLALLAALGGYLIYRTIALLLDPTGDPAFRIAVAVLDGIILIFYGVLVALCLRAWWMLRRVKPDTPTPALAEMVVVFDAPYKRLARRCLTALRRLGADLRQVDLTRGSLHARRHLFFNLYKDFFDEITIQIKEVSPTRCEVTLHSDGIMPSWASDARRNQNNLKSLINYITE
jgi:hypothetical protein